MSCDIQTNSKVAAATPVLAVAGAYIAGDCVGTLLTFTQPFREPRSGVVHSLILTDLAKQAAALDLIFFSSNPSASTFTDNSPIDIHDTDLAKVAGHISIEAGDYCASADSGFATKPGAECGLVIQLDGTDTLYAVLVSRGTPTYTAGDLTLRVGLLVD